jgi:hypothetical protein
VSTCADCKYWDDSGIVQPPTPSDYGACTKIGQWPVPRTEPVPPTQPVVLMVGATRQPLNLMSQGTFSCALWEAEP